MSDALVGDTLERLRLTLADQYGVTRELGRGGMAVVYLADDLRHDRQVAIKVLLPELAASLGGDRFLREIRVAAKLQHPHILPLFDSGSRDGLLYYVMPFVEGESLRDKLTRERQLDIGEAIRLAGEVADALHYAHARGVVHRDIKPENIMLSGGHALVADFGIAKAVSAAGGERLTQTGMAIGTPYYMSPEQAMGEGIDGRGDQYSLACVLYELLAGQPPFTGPTPMAVLARHSLEKVPSLQIVRHSIPEGVELVVLRGLEKVAADRYPNMNDFAEALRSAEIDRISTRTGARAVPTRELPRSPATEDRRRNRLLIVAGALALLTGTGVFLWRRGAESAPLSAVAEGPDPRRVAVLYFGSRGGSDSLAYLADGLTEALINELAGVKALQVISRNGVTPYRNTAVAPDSIARALGVGTLVSGTVTQSGDRLRVNVALVNAMSGAEIGNQTIDRARSELFALQDDLAKEVSIFLRERLGEEIELRDSRAGTRNVAAWELVQQATHAMTDAEALAAQGDSAGATRRHLTADSILARAEALDPAWIVPITSRGWLAYQQTRLAGNFDKSYYATWFTEGRAQADRALQIDAADAAALELRATLRYWQWLLNLSPDAREAAKLFADAERDFRASVAANPAQATAWTSLTHLLLAKGEIGEAKLAALKAYEGDPYLKTANLTVWRLFQSSLDLEDGVEARHWCGEGGKRFPGDARFAECRLWLYVLKDQTPDVPAMWKLVEEYERLSSPNLREYRRLYGRMIVAMGLARAGLRDSARAVATRSRAGAQLDPTRDLAYLEAIVRNLTGDTEDVLRLMSTYLATNPQLRESFARDQSWYFRNLQSDPKYRALVGGGG